MKKISIYISSVIFFLFVVKCFFLTIEPFKGKYEVLDNKKSIINTISSYIILPIIESRIDFYLKNSGVITHLEKNKYDNKIIYTKDIIEGSGESVLCGQIVSIVIEDIDNSIKEEKTIKIGTDYFQFLNIGLIGMKENGKRLIVIPSKISERMTGIKNKKKSYEITLKKVISHYIKSTKDILIFENIIGDRQAVMCGDEVILKYNIKNSKGHEIKKDILSFKVGSGKAPLALELGVIEMVPGSKRTILSPPDLLNSDFLENQINIIDLTID